MVPSLCGAEYWLAPHHHFVHHHAAPVYPGTDRRLDQGLTHLLSRRAILGASGAPLSYRLFYRLSTCYLTGYLADKGVARTHDSLLQRSDLTPLPAPGRSARRCRRRLSDGGAVGREVR